MPRKTEHPKGAPCWIDLSTSDQARARDFYTALFGWTAGEPDPQFGGYFTFSKDGVEIAGCMGRMPDQQGPDAWLVHLCTPDARQTVKDAQAHGGSVIVEPMDVADLGTMSVILDPGGAAVGGWQPGTMKGFGIVYESDVPAWFELHTRKYAEAIDFYRTVFGWNTASVSDTPQLHYTVLQLGDDQFAGIMDDSPYAPEGTPAYWLVYFGAANADATAAKIKQLGGSITREPEDTPYGRMASCTDPTGAAFNIIQPLQTAAAQAGSQQASGNA